MWVRTSEIHVHVLEPDQISRAQSMAAIREASQIGQTFIPLCEKEKTEEKNTEVMCAEPKTSFFGLLECTLYAPHQRVEKDYRTDIAPVTRGQ